MDNYNSEKGVNYAGLMGIAALAAATALPANAEAKSKLDQCIEDYQKAVKSDASVIKAEVNHKGHYVVRVQDINGNEFFVTDFRNDDITDLFKAYSNGKAVQGCSVNRKTSKPWINKKIEKLGLYAKAKEHEVFPNGGRPARLGARW